MTIGDERKSREDWLAAGRKVLATSGVERLKIDRLATEMQSTRGSFYWHFSSRKELLDALLGEWEVKNQVAVATYRERWLGSRPDLSEFVDWFVTGAELPTCDWAIRVWASRAAHVEHVMRRVDEQWIDLLQLLFPTGIYHDSERLVRARVLYYLRVGYQAQALREPRSEYLHLIPYYFKVLIGHEPGISRS